MPTSVVPEGTVDPLLTDPATGQPLSYVQFARLGLLKQRTQISKNMGMPRPGNHDSGYTLYGSVLNNASSESSTARQTITAAGNAVSQQARRSMRAQSAIDNANLANQPSFFDGIDTSIEGIATLAPDAPSFLPSQLARLTEEIAAATRAFDPHDPAKAAPALRDALQTTDALIGQVSNAALAGNEKANVLHELRIKRVQLNDALVLALGLHLDATAPSSDVVEDTAAVVETSLSESSPASLTLSHLSIDGALPTQRQFLIAPAAEQLADGKPLVQSAQIPAGHTTEITQPYFYRENIEQPVYKLRDPALRNAPQTPAPLTAWATVTYQGAEITLGRIVHDGPQPVSIVPPVSIASAPAATVLPNGQTTAELTATLSTDASTSANVNVQSPRNWSLQAKAIPAAAGDTSHSIQFFLHPIPPIAGPQIFHVTAQTPDHHIYSEGYRAVGYPGLITTNDYTPATTRVVPVDLKLPEHVRIAYLPGTGDPIPQALASIGLTPSIITVADINAARLASFDTVILGVRAYTAHADLHGAPTQALLDFARNGGNVLVQYQTSDFTSADAPYPLSLGDAEKVVDETDPVQILAPSNPLLTTPNQISSADFDGWIEERGHGFLESWAPQYVALTETRDPGGPETAVQLPQRGGLITASVGKGRWTYCAFALYRQLPEAVPGAFRLFVNLLAPAR